MIELFLIPLAVSIAGSAIYSGMQDFIARNNSALKTSIRRTSTLIDQDVVEGAEFALHKWTSGGGFARVLQRLEAGECGIEDEIVQSFLNDGEFYLSNENDRIRVAEEILDVFIGVLVGVLYQSDAGIPILANRIEGLHADQRNRLDQLAVGMKELKDHLGGGKPPIERVQRYLEDLGGWEWVNEGVHLDGYYHYKRFPEFTLKVGELDSDGVVREEEWTRGEIRTDSNSAWAYLIYYHQTLLHRAHVVSFDDDKKSMVAPDFRARGKGRFYFYEADSVDYALQRFHSAVRRKDDSTRLRIRGQGEIVDEAREFWGHQMRIPVLFGHELDGFMVDKAIVAPSHDESEQYRLFLRNQLDFESWRIEVTSVREARGFRGIGWNGDLDELRTDRAK